MCSLLLGKNDPQIPRTAENVAKGLFQTKALQRGGRKKKGGQGGGAVVYDLTHDDENEENPNMPDISLVQSTAGGSSVDGQRRITRSRVASTPSLASAGAMSRPAAASTPAEAPRRRRGGKTREGPKRRQPPTSTSPRGAKNRKTSGVRRSTRRTTRKTRNPAVESSDEEDNGQYSVDVSVNWQRSG